MALDFATFEVFDVPDLSTKFSDKISVVSFLSEGLMTLQNFCNPFKGGNPFFEN